MEKLKRYGVFMAGLFVSSLGVSFVTKADLGTSPISSIPYTLSLKYDMTLGEFTIAFSLLLILLQIAILRRGFRKESLLQIPVSVLFGYFIDLTMLLINWVNPGAYIMKIIMLLAGCIILGFGVYLEVLANVVMLPGEAFVQAVTLTWKKDFGPTKVVFDASMTIMAGIISFVIFQEIQGVREGTVVAALVVGFVAKFFGKRLGFMEKILFTTATEKEYDKLIENV